MYNRLEAMKVAKEQALVREKAADYIRDGQEVPENLMYKYKKTISHKLNASKSKSNNHDMRSGQPAQPPAGPAPPERSARGAHDMRSGQPPQHTTGDIDSHSADPRATYRAGEASQRHGDQ